MKTEDIKLEVILRKILDEKIKESERDGNSDSSYILRNQIVIMRTLAHILDILEDINSKIPQ